jgi:hypothetical protein
MSTLTDDEMARIRAELLDNVLSLGAEPYIGIKAIYQVIRETVVSSSVAPTASSTVVTVTGPAVITLASVVGITMHTRVQLDVDESREVVTVRAVAGSTISVICRKTHAGTYPVEIESPLTIVRGLLADLESVRDQIAESRGSLGLRRVDEVEWSDGASQHDRLVSAQQRLRRELAARVGLSGMFAGAGNGNGTFEVY